MSELDDTVVVLVDIQESDLLRENFWFYYSKRFVTLTVIALLIGLMYGLWVLPIIGYSNPAEAVTALAPLLLFASFGGSLPVVIWWQTKRGFSNLKDFQKNVRYTFSATGFSVQDGKSSANLSWDSIHKAVETKRSFNIFTHKLLFQVVPKRCIQQQEDIARLRRILKQSLGDKAAVDGLIERRTG